MIKSNMFWLTIAILLSSTSLMMAQNVGIGTSSPGAKLDVNGNGRYLNEVRFLNDTRMKGMVWGSTSWTNYFTRIDDYNGNLHIMTDDGLNFSDINDVTGAPGTIRFFMNMDNGRFGIGTTNPGFPLDVIGDIKATGNLVTDGKLYGEINVFDTRNDNQPPTYYNNEVAFDFKNRTTVGAPGSGTYSGMMTIAPWGDDSGDASHQINFNEGGLYWRQGQPNSASWGAWTRILTEDYSSNNYIFNQTTQQSGANFNISGTGTATQLNATANGNWFLRGGDDHELRDVNVANTIGIWGRQNPDRGGIQLGSDGSYIYGDNGNIGIGVYPTAGKLHVDGVIYAADRVDAVGGLRTQKQIFKFTRYRCHGCAGTDALGYWDFCALAGYSYRNDDDYGDDTDTQCNVYNDDQCCWGDNSNSSETDNYGYTSQPYWRFYSEAYGDTEPEVTCTAICIKFDY